MLSCRCANGPPDGDLVDPSRNNKSNDAEQTTRGEPASYNGKKTQDQRCEGSTSTRAGQPLVDQAGLGDDCVRIYGINRASTLAIRPTSRRFAWQLWNVAGSIQFGFLIDTHPA